MGHVGTRVFLAVMVSVAVTVGLAAAASTGSAPDFIETGYDRTIRALTGNDPRTRCWSAFAIGFGGPRVYYIDGEARADCYLEPRRFRGIFIDEFEGWEFVEGLKPADRYSYRHCDAAWLEFQASTPGSDLLDTEQPLLHRIWEVELIGRPSPDFAFIPLGARYGMGVSQKSIFVDQVTSARILRTYRDHGGWGDGAFIRGVWPDVSCDSPR